MKRNSLRDEKGVVLLITLLVVALCTALAVEFNYETRIKLDYAANYKEQLGAYYIAQSGLKAARALLQTDSFEGRYDSMKEMWAQTSMVPVPLGDGMLNLLIEDECSKLNVNNLVRPSGVVFQRRLDFFLALLDILEIDENIADTIIDWLDPDDETGTYGAENSHYLSLNPNYPCKNAFLDSLEELRLVDKITYDVYKKLKPYITIYTGEDEHININTAPPEVLMALSADLTEEVAADIITYRQEQSFQMKTELREVSTLDPNIIAEIIPYIDIKSNAFKITSVGTVDESRKILTAVVRRDQGGGTTVLYMHIH